MASPRKLARLFASEMAARLEALPKPEARRRFRAAVEKPGTQDSAAFQPLIEEWAPRFARKHGTGPLLFDVEGSKKAEREYEVLGTTAWPDAVVLKPFRCAIEFDTQPVPKGSVNSSRFRERLIKPLMHLLSDRYEACLFVYVLRHPEHSRLNYTDDDSPETARVMRFIHERGISLAFVPV